MKPPRIRPWARVAVSEPAQVAEHLRLGAVAAEHGMGEDFRSATRGDGDALSGFQFVERGRASKRGRRVSFGPVLHLPLEPVGQKISLRVSIFVQVDIRGA